MVDSKGPRWGVALGIVLFGVGYYPIAKGILSFCIEGDCKTLTKC